MITSIIIFVATISVIALTFYIRSAHAAAQVAETQSIKQEVKEEKENPKKAKYIESDWSKLQRLMLRKFREAGYPKIKFKGINLAINYFTNNLFKVSRPEKRRFWKNYCKIQEKVQHVL